MFFCVIPKKKLKKDSLFWLESWKKEERCERRGGDKDKDIYLVLFFLRRK